MPIVNLTEGVISELSKAQRAAYPALRSLAAGNLSANEILRQLSAAGQGIARQAGLDIIAVLRNKADLSQFFRTFGEGAPIPGGLHKVSPTTLGGGKKYSYLVGTNSANEQIPEAIYVSSNAPLNANQIYGAAISTILPGGSNAPENADVTDVVLTIDDARFAPGTQLTDEVDTSSLAGLYGP